MAQHEPSDHKGKTTVWLTPPHIQPALGGWRSFDLDPCAVTEPRPWPTARRMIALPEDGLTALWSGRVWLNPPYGDECGRWMERMAKHGTGTALIFARTENTYWHDWVWPHATAMLFLKGRLFFHKPDGSRGKDNAGTGSVLIAYGESDAGILRTCGLAGHYVPLQQVRTAIASMPLTWRRAVVSALVDADGEASLKEVYSRVQRPTRNRHWQEQVRKQVQRVGEQVERGRWRLRRVS